MKMWGWIGSILIGLSASAWLGAIAFGSWFPRAAERSLIKEVVAHGRADKWLHAGLALLTAALDQLVGPPTAKKRARGIAAALAILLVVMSIAGTLTKTFLGFEKSPWAAYDDTIQSLRKTNDRPKEAKTEAEEQVASAYSASLTAAGAPHWKYVYSTLAIPLTLVIYVAAFFRSVKGTRRLISEIEGAQTWVQKAGIACFATISLFCWAVILVLAYAFVSSPMPTIMLLLARLFSLGWVLLGALCLAVFEFLVGDPWFKALVLASLLPAAMFVAAALVPLASDLTSEMLVGARNQALEVARQRLGSVFIPLCMTIGAILCVVVFLRAVL